MTDWQNVPIHFGGGQDTKTDPKLVQAGKLLRCQDAVQVASNQWRKRNGYQKLSANVLGGGTITSPRLITAFKNELVLADSVLGKLLSYSPTDSVWVPKGDYAPVEVKNTIVSRFAGSNASFLGQIDTTGATLGNIAVFAWAARVPPSGFLSPMASVVDLASGVTLTSDYILSATVSPGSNQVRVMVLGGSVLAIVFAMGTSIQMSVVNTSTGAIGAPVSITTDTSILKMSACATTVGGAASYYNGTSYKVVTFDTSGTLTHTATIAAGNGGDTVVTAESFTGNIWVYWGDSTTFDVRYAVYSSTLASVLVATTISTTPQVPFAFIPVEVSSGVQKLLFSYNALSSATAEFLYTTNKAQVQSNGTVGSATLFVQNVFPSSYVFTLSGVQYLRCTYKSRTQSTYFILRLSDASVLAKLLPGSADSFTTIPAQPIQMSATKVLIPCGDAYAVDDIGGTDQAIVGSSYSTLDAGSSETYQAIQANKNLVLNGGQVYSYDGRAVSELGFHLYPAIMSATPSGSGGSIAAGTYQYFALYRFYDESGNIYASSPSIAATATTTGASSSVSLVVSYLAQTSKHSGNAKCIVEIYRTAANGLNAYLIKKQINDPTTSSFTYVDTAADATVTSASPLYTTGGIIENISPPAAIAMALYNNRLWIIPSENKNQVWYSKTFVESDGVNFSDLLIQQIGASGGECTAIASMDDKLIVFEERTPFVISGDGPNDTGTGSTLSDAQPIPSDAGCSQSKGVIAYPGGVLFRSPKGLYSLDRSLSVKYWGADVEAYNSQRISASTMIYDKNQIRFLCDSGLTLVYDYYFGQWSTFSNHMGYSACIWNGSYVYVRTDGSIYVETPGYYLDDTSPFAPLLQSGWLAISSVQGFQRVRRFLMLGDYVNGASASHGVQVSAAYDFSTTFSTPIPCGFGGASSSGVFQYRERLPIQKCDTISLIIQELTTGDSAEYVDFTDMSFEAGVKRGLRKLASARSVG